MIMDFIRIRDIIKNAAKDAGICEYEIYCTKEENLSADTLKDEISTFNSCTSSGVGFRCIINGKMGYASTNITDESELYELVRCAAENAEIIENDDKVFIFDGSCEYTKINRIHVYSADAEELKRCALKVQRDAYSQGEYVAEGTESGTMLYNYERYLYNSYGLELSSSSGMTGCYCSSVVNVNGEAKNNFEFALGLEGDEVDSLAKRSVDGALEKIGAGGVESGRYDVIIDGDCMKNLLSTYSSVFSAKNARMGLSLLAGKEGEMVADECVTITDDPTRDGCPMQATFDGEGVATYKKTVIDKGVLKTLLYDLTNAEMSGKSSTGNGQRSSYASQVAIKPYNFSINAGDKSLEEMFADIGNGIYITSLQGLHAAADAVTGDFSLESAGFMIRDGKKAEAVKSFTVAGNFFDLLKNITAVSNKVTWGIPADFCVFGSPCVAVKDLSVAGK